ncbi:alkaline shock response membrane anchor protein AmaP [Paenibacillus athensensis]|uniref:Alkaline shock response membrane anchor protein AmaP n=1 Tax=Paenibacillus athensensis TaxID=1967502 RepID=A0A4Y8Q1I5_9BACL|nr:alkaline shock response membrane anchor protein AmaP [Paenibacillus athensensis]MCD1260686.1 alkaline shock response membrane anchor protein AmaP [Paenibacillus athensensis]
MIKIVDRFLLLIYSLIVFAASIVVLFATFGWIDKSDADSVLSDLYTDDRVAVTAIIIAAVILLISVRFLYVSLRRSRSQTPSIDQRTDYGDIRISLETVENLSLKAAGRTKGVKDLRARVKVSPAGLEILIRTVVDGESSIPDMTEEMQNGVKRYIEDITGIPVASVTVYVANIVQSAPTFRSRVE